MFIATLFMIAQTGNNQNAHRKNGFFKIMAYSYIHRPECYLAIERNKTQITANMNDLKTIIVDSRSHTPKTCIIPLIRSTEKARKGSEHRHL